MRAPVYIGQGSIIRETALGETNDGYKSNRGIPLRAGAKSLADQLWLDHV